MMRENIFLTFLLFNLILVHGIADSKHYIVYMGEHSSGTKDAVVSANHAMLAAIIGSDLEAKEAAVHHYGHTFRGFSAMLTQEQAAQLEEHEEVISVFESQMVELHSTHSWDFMGVHMQGSLGSASKLGSDVIIGVIDTGIWPESKSFDDKGLGPVPKRFKGECETGQNFTKSNCNRKIIGARYYSKGMEAAFGPLEKANSLFYRSPRDSDGHGTLTASTAAGAAVDKVNVFGLAGGTARGGAPGARIAVYKACWFLFCNDADLLSAFDQAVFDGVDVISISAGFSPTRNSFLLDPIAIGSFHAFRRGIVVSASAGNSGGKATATNVAPWMLTVAASSIDRRFDAYVKLGNNVTLRGASLNGWALERPHLIVEGKTAALHGATTANASYCHLNSLDRKVVSGKVVVCSIQQGAVDRRVYKAVEVKRAGGVGMIIVDHINEDAAREYVVPSVLIGEADARLLYKYLASQRKPVASIYEAVMTMGRKIRAPKVTVFSSRGPNVVTPDIIKPDITAPGLNILAAWSPVAVEDTADTPMDYFIASGTSMSAPHVSAAAAIVKSHHQGWSPSTIMSALMTTATMEDSKRKRIVRYPNRTRSAAATPFDYGSGHLNPVAAIKPGLVYGFSSAEIIDFLCVNRASSGGLKNLTGVAVKCKTKLAPSHDFNYPSIGVSAMKGATSVYRTVKSVEGGRRVYEVSVERPPGVLVRVVPSKLEFKKKGEKKTFRVDLVPHATTGGEFKFGSLTWNDGVHQVRSPIAVNVVSR